MLLLGSHVTGVITIVHIPVFILLLVLLAFMWAVTLAREAAHTVIKTTSTTHP